MAQHMTMEQLKAGLPEIMASPKDEGTLEGIVVRPASGERLEPRSVRITAASGLEGDHWSKGCWKTTEDGSPDPDVQICIMNARCIALVAQSRDNWAPAGDNFFIDMDLTPENLAPGQRLSVGSAVIEITAVPHNGCQSFIERYGRDACLFVNSGEGRKLRLRGIYARVVKNGEVSLGDRVTKIADEAAA